MKHINLFVLVLMFSTLTACGGGDEGFGGDNTPIPADETPPPGDEQVILPPPPGETTADHAISISIPETDAIRKLDGDAAGDYSLTGTLTVTDRNGNPVPAGTVVHLDIIDTVKATGTINHANVNDNIIANTLIDSNPELADGTTGRLFDNIFVMRDGSPRFIGPNDLVLLTNNAFQTDMNRSISVADGAITANTITVSSSYSANYATSIFANTNYFDPAETSYLIGSSEMGIKIHGIDPVDDTVTTPSLAQTDKNGIAKFRIEYPANSGTIHMGCTGTETAPDSGIANDERFDVAGSSEVYMIARLDGNNAVTTIEHDQLCYKSILPWSMTMNPSVIITGNSGATPYEFTITVEDAEGVNLPYIKIDSMHSISTDPGGDMIITPDTTSCPTAFDGSGSCVVTIEVEGADSGDAGEVTFFGRNGITATVPITIP